MLLLNIATLDLVKLTIECDVLGFKVLVVVDLGLAVILPLLLVAAVGLVVLVVVVLTAVMLVLSVAVAVKVALAAVVGCGDGSVVTVTEAVVFRASSVRDVSFAVELSDVFVNSGEVVNCFVPFVFSSSVDGDVAVTVVLPKQKKHQKTICL